MPLQIVRNDITKMKVDCIVNAANNSLLGGGGVDGAIHRAAGHKLLEECKKLNGCDTGDAKITGAYNLPCKYIVHTVGPVWNGGHFGEELLLRSCYKKSLNLAKENKCNSIAFPLISSGVYGYPKDEALKIAVDEISKFLKDNDITAYVVVFDKKAYKISEKLYEDIEAYIDDNYIDEDYYYMQSSRRDIKVNYSRRPASGLLEPKGDFTKRRCLEEDYIEECQSSISLEDALEDIDESFTEMLLRKIDESGMTDSKCYKKANIDRKLFSKIRKDMLYKPSKPTALSFAVALELSLPETEDMLRKAGYALSHSNKFDIIVEYFIKNKNYNIFEINEALFAFDQSLLGSH